MPRGLCVLLLASAPLALVAADESPAAAAAAPYRVTVALRFARNPILTPLFAESVRRQVRDQLANLVGPLAQIDVRTSGHWLLDEFADRPIDEPLLSAEVLAKHPAPERIFLCGIRFEDSRYRLAWRQLDSALQYIGAVQEQATPDRQWIAKAICLAIKHDFALVADVERNAVGGISLELRGSENLELVKRLLPDESIWQPYQIEQRGGVEVRRAMAYTLLRVSKQKLGQPDVLSYHAEPFAPRASIARIEAVKLPDRTGRLRLRLVDQVTGQPNITCRVEANDVGFDRFQPADALNQPSREGIVISRREFRNVAYVKIYTGGDAAISLPLPITAEYSDHEIRVAADPKAMQKNDFERLLRGLKQDVTQLQALQSDTVRRFNESYKTKRYEDALQLVTASIASMEPSLSTARTTLASLQNKAADMTPRAHTSLEVSAKELAQAEARLRELAEIKTGVERTIATRDAQTQADVQIKLAQQAERDGDGDVAIERYEFALHEQPNQPALRARLDKLKTLWAQKSLARELVYDRWAPAKLADIPALLPDVERAVESLQSAGDYIALYKLLAANSAQAAAVSAFVEQVSTRGGEADKQEADRYAALVERIDGVQKGAAVALEKLLAADQPPAAAAAADSTPPASPKAAAPKAGQEEEPPLK